VERSSRFSRSQKLAKIPILAAALALAAPAGFAQAEEAEAEPERPLVVDNIVITAEKREESLQQTPLAVTAFTPSAIEELDIKNVLNLGEFTPNLNIHTNAGGNTGLTIGIRGAITTDPILSLEPTVGIYMNGVYVGKSVGALFDMPDLNHIEVLRGPQGTLYGRNTVGGAVTLQTTKPSGELGLAQQVRFGNFYHVRSTTTLELPLIGGNGLDVPDALGTLSTRGTFVYETRDGFYNNSGGEDDRLDAITGLSVNPGSDRLDDLDRKSWLVAANWEFPWHVNLDYVYDGHRARELPSAFQATFVYPGSAVDSPPFDVNPFASGSRLWDVPNNAPMDAFQNERPLNSNLDVSGHAINLEGDLPTLRFLGDVTLKAIVGIRSLENQDAVDLDGSPYHIQDFGLDIEHDQVSVELQWVGETDQWDYVIGFYYYDEDGSALNNQGAFGQLGANLAPGVWASFGANSVVSYFELDNYTLAPFGQATWTLPWLQERFKITGGLRYSYESRKMFRDYDCVMSTDGPAGPVFPGPTPTTLCPLPGDDLSSFTDSGSDTFDDWSPMANLSVQATEDIMAYFRAARGFKSGGFNGRANTEALFRSPYESEKLWSYELGLRTTWLDQRLLVNASGFFSDYEDMQVTIFTPTSGLPLTDVVNAGQAQIGGLEIETVAVPIEGLSIRFAYAYLHPEYDELINPSLGGDISDIANFVLAPKHSVSTGIGYVLPPFRFGTLSGRLDIYWQDMVHFATVTFDGGENAQDSYATLSARVELAEIPLGRYLQGAVAIWGKNLMDEEYRTFGIDFGPDLGISGNTYGHPRTYGMDLTLLF